jgi:hypothetical protein
VPTSVNYESSSYNVPSQGERLWAGASRVDGLLLALAQNVLQKVGGNFTLAADVNWGTVAGHVLKYIKSSSSNIATTGVVRFANNEGLAWRNAANGANLVLKVNASNALEFDGVALGGNIPATQGGTGITTYALGDTLYSSAANTISKLSGNTTTTKKFLVQTGNGTVSAAPAWDVLIAADVPSLAASIITSGTFAEARGGTNQSTYTRGDLLYASAANTLSKLAIGTTGKFLKTDGTDPSWQALAAGDIPSLDASKITTGSLAKARGGAGADMSSVTFPSSGTIATTFSSSQVLCDSPNGHGSTNNKIRRFTNSATTGTDITYADSATLGATFTINTAGLYAISYADFCTAASAAIGISLNSSQLTTTIGIITTANRLLSVSTPTANLRGTLTVIARLAATDVIRAHTDGTPDATGAAQQFSIVRIG